MHLKIKFMITLELNKVVFKKYWSQTRDLQIISAWEL